MQKQIDHLFMFEAQSHKPEAIFAPVPATLLSRYSYFNIPVSATKGDKFHAWTFLENAKRSEYVVVKLDIDTPSVETPLVEQLVASAKYQTLMDEFFFEHHVKYSAMARWWGATTAGAW